MFNWPKSRTLQNWDKIYQVWKARNSLTTTEERTTVVRQCKKKFAYDNFLDLLKAANQLSEDEVFLPGRYINIYQCEICGMGHIGNQRTPVDIGYDWWFYDPSIWKPYKRFKLEIWPMEDKGATRDTKS